MLEFNGGTKAIQKVLLWKDRRGLKTWVPTKSKILWGKSPFGINSSPSPSGCPEGRPLWRGSGGVPQIYSLPLSLKGEGDKEGEVLRQPLLR